ncbi:hypothetical protein ACFL1R_04035 [Candidatus Latescibacterota bacterium]
MKPDNTLPFFAHYVNDDKIFFSRGTNLFMSDNMGKTWEKLGKIPLSSIDILKSSHRLLRRLFRCHIHHIQPVNKSTLLLFGFGKIFRVQIRETITFKNCGDIVGRRPLFLCNAGFETFYYGEYKRNSNYDPIRIMGSENGGCTWETVRTISNIRHIHGVFHDPYDDAIWVTTGDRDHESGLWVTHDRFITLEKVVGGDQQKRVMQLLFTANYIYFGSDTGDEKNYLYRMSKKSRRIKRLQEVNGSVYWGCKVGNALFFSTALEPSKINKSQDACIWGTFDGEIWKSITHFRKDIWPTTLFQFGQVLFPVIENNNGYLWFTPFATNNDQTLQRIAMDKIISKFADSQYPL